MCTLTAVFAALKKTAKGIKFDIPSQNFTKDRICFIGINKIGVCSYILCIYIYVHIYACNDDSQTGKEIKHDLVFMIHYFYCISVVSFLPATDVFLLFLASYYFFLHVSLSSIH